MNDVWAKSVDEGGKMLEMIVLLQAGPCAGGAREVPKAGAASD
ncbi:hypothetical protein C4K09_2858 [Pseudomonas chlororaphis subsp. aureofaciens]|nr:hypothetical protein C4K09_2858 [Pseudomonas chlororaphis subsp. aureofaciens]